MLYFLFELPSRKFPMFCRYVVFLYKKNNNQKKFSSYMQPKNASYFWESSNPLKYCINIFMFHVKHYAVGNRRHNFTV